MQDEQMTPATDDQAGEETAAEETVEGGESTETPAEDEKASM